MKQKTIIVAIAFFLLLLATASYAQPIDPATIIPKPKSIQTLSTTAVSIDSSWKIAADLATEDSFAATDLNKKISAALGTSLGIVDITAMPAEKRIVIGNPNTNAAIAAIASSAGININNELTQDKFNQGYVLIIQPNQILILGNTTAGTFYGVVSLTWLLKKEGSSIILPNAKITDWPDLKIRGFYGGTEPTIWDPYSRQDWPPYYGTQEAWVEHLAKYKYNIWINGPLTEYVRDRHFFTSTKLGLPPYAEGQGKNLHEGVWAYNAPFRFNSSGIAEPAGGVELPNPDLEFDEDGDGVPDGWKYSNYPIEQQRGQWTRDCTQSHSGNCSVKMVAEHTLGLDSSSYFLTESQIPIESDKIYMFTFWAKKNDPNNNDRQPQFTVVMKDEPGNTLIIGGASVYYNGNITDNSGEWKQYFLMFTSFNGAAGFTIYSRAMFCEPVTWWLDDFELIDLTKALRNVIRTPDTGLQVWNKDRTVKYTEGTDYTLSTTGEFNFSNPLAGKKTTVQRVEGGRILPGAEVAIDYDFIVNFQQTRNEYASLSDPAVLDEYRNNIKSTMEKKPDFVFIGMDEIRGFNRDSRSKKRGFENYQVLGKFLNKMVDIIHSYNADTKVLIWDDMISPFHNGGVESYQAMYGGQTGKSWHALDLLKRENVVPIDWWYTTNNQYLNMENGPNLYNTLGFEFFGGPWYDETAIKWWSYLANKYNALGIIDHEFYNNVGGVVNTAEYSWNTLKDNPGIEICDGADNDGDARYWTSSSSTATWSTPIDEPFNLQNDPFNCGSCSNVCYYPHAFSSCVAGSCHFDGCFEGYQNSNGNLSDGCESYTACGNGGVDDDLGEQCDGTALFGESCVSLGYFGGTLGCTAQCTLDKSGCAQTPECVDTPTLMNQYIPQWKRGEISMLALMQKMKQWKAGTGCLPA